MSEGQSTGLQEALLRSILSVFALNMLLQADIRAVCLRTQLAFEFFLEVVKLSHVIDHSSSSRELVRTVRTRQVLVVVFDALVQVQFVPFVEDLRTEGACPSLGTPMNSILRLARLDMALLVRHTAYV